MSEHRVFAGHPASSNRRVSGSHPAAPNRHASTSGRVAALVLLAAAFLAFAGVGSAGEVEGSECELGVTLALNGDVSRAESVFVSLLSHDLAGARALTNLGNLYLMKGELDVAVAFYDLASRSDTTDAGILLNRSVALMLMGEEDLALAQAKEGIEMAGGMKSASSMLGLRWLEAEAASKGAEKLYVSKEEISALLSAALKSVPADTTQEAASPEPRKDKGKAVAWRSAGARASGGTQVGHVLYWKR